MNIIWKSPLTGVVGNTIGASKSSMGQDVIFLNVATTGKLVKVALDVALAP